MQEKIPFPTAREINGRLYFVERELESYKCALAGLPLPPTDGPVKFVPAKVAAAQFGISRRTIGRRIVERAAAERQTEPAAA